MPAEISIKKALVITATAKYANIILGMVFIAILARLLTPEDFGTIAIAMVFIAFFNIIPNSGLGPVIVQDKSLTDEEINHIYSFSIYVGVILIIAFFLLGFPMAWFYQNSEYIFICLILSLSLFFNVLNIVPNALLRKEGRFLLLGIRLIVVSTATYGITIVLALMQFNHYALVIQSVLSAFFIFLWNAKTVKLRPKIKIDFATLRKIQKYSGYDFGFSFINYFARNLDKLIVGRVWGAVPLAQYDRAYRFMLFPVQNLTLVIGSVLHPALSRRQNDLEHIYHKYLHIVKPLSLLGVFVTVFCFWSSWEIIILIFGNQWYEAVDFFKWLSLSIWAQMVTSSAGAIYKSIGNTKLMFISGLVHVSVSILVIILGVLSGNLIVFSICVSVGFIVKFFIEFFFLIKIGFGKSIVSFLRRFVPDIIIFLLLFVGLFFFSRLLDSADFSLIFLLAMKLGFTLVLYSVCLLFTGQWVHVKKIIYGGNL